MIEQGQAILSEFQRRLTTDPKVRSILRRIGKGKATLADTAALSDRAADLLGEVFGAAVLDIPEDVREAVCEGLLREQYDSTMNTCDGVLEALDSAQELHLTPQHPGFPIERVQQLASSLTDPTVKLETIQRRASKPVATVAKSFHDSYIRINAQTRHDLGIKCYLDRVAAPGCCAWCTGIAGRYVYGEHPKDIFRRHDNCSCTVTFENGRERQDVWSKRTWDARDPKEIERVASRPAKLTQQQAEQLQENAVSRLTLAGERDIMKLDSIELFNGSDTLAANTKTDLDKALDPVPEKLLERLSGYVSNVEISNGRGYSSYNRSTHEIILNGDTAAFDIVHELGHAFGDMLGLYDDEEFLGILSDGLNIDDWYDVLRMKHPYTGADVWVLNAEKFVDPYQGRIYADVSDVDWSAPIDKKFFREYISVGFDTFFSNPELLKSKDLKLYEFLRGKVYG